MIMKWRKKNLKKVLFVEFFLLKSFNLIAWVIEATQSAASPGESARKTSDDFCHIFFKGFILMSMRKEEFEDHEGFLSQEILVI